jgi:hypothetical protein
MLKLRADVEVEWSDDAARLHDPVFDRDVRLGPMPASVVRLLDGKRTLDQISAESGRARSEVDEALRTLVHLNLVDGAGAEIVERARRVQRGQEKLGRVLLGESRFGCIGSGDCCQSYHFGPLTDEDVARLDKLPIAEAFPQLEAPYIYERELPGTDRMGRFLKSVDNRCLFLLDDCKCGLHAKFGYDSKPGLCRYYPFEQFATLDGVQMYDKGGCSQFAVTARSGRTLNEQLDELLPLMPRVPVVHHPVVLLTPTVPVDFGYVHPLLQAAVDELDRPPAGAPEMLRAFARRSDELARALDACAVEPEAPARILKDLLARGVAPYLAPPDEAAVRAGAVAAAEVAQALSSVVILIISVEHHENAEYYSGRQSKELIPILHLVEEVARHVGEGLPLSDYAREVAAIDADERDADDVLRISLRNQLFGHGALLNDRVVAAQLRLAFVQLVSLWGARLRALSAGRTRIVADDLSRAHMLATRVPSWDAVRRVFVEKEAQLRPLAEALPELARWRAPSLSGTMEE